MKSRSFYVMTLRANAKKRDLIKLAQNTALRNKDRNSLQKPSRNILTVRAPSAGQHVQNRATAAELTEVEYEKIRSRAWQYLDTLDYKSSV